MRVSFMFLPNVKKHIRVSVVFLILLGNTYVFSFFCFFAGKHICVFYFFCFFDEKPRSKLGSVGTRLFFLSALQSLSRAQGYTAHVLSLFQTFHCFHSCAQQRIVEILSVLDIARRRHRLGETVWRTDWCSRICGRSGARFRHNRGCALYRGVLPVDGRADWPAIAVAMAIAACAICAVCII